MAEAQKHISVDVTTEFQGATIRPGDKLIVAFHDRVNMSEYEEIKGKLASHLPGIEVVVLDGVSGMAIYRPDQKPEGERMLCPFTSQQPRRAVPLSVTPHQRLLRRLATSRGT